MQPGSLDIRDEADGGRLTLVLRGELELITAPSLERAVEAALAGGAGELILDVREVTFVDSTGFRALLAAKGACRDAEADFAMTRGPEAVQRVFHVGGVLKRLPFV